ncbi:MAG: PAS domain S-box protein [Chromatiales bacterium]|nr:PAS domain S-box protein [Chromatiales bacterium]
MIDQLPRECSGSQAVTHEPDVALHIRSGDALSGIQVDPGSLLQEAAQLRHILDLAPDAVLLLGADQQRGGHIVWANRAAEEMHGHAAGALDGRPVISLLAPGRSRPPPEREGDIRAGKVVSFPSVHKRRDGSLFEVEMTARRIVLDGQAYTLVFARDVSDRERMARALRASEARIRALLAALPDRLFVIDRAGTIREVYASGRAGLLATPEQLVGRQLSALLNPERAAKLMNAIEQSACSSQIVELQLEIPDPPGEDQGAVHIELRVIPMAGDQFLVVSRDISEQYRAKAQFESLARRLEVATEGAGIGLWEFAPETGLLYWAPMMYRLFGVAIDDPRTPSWHWKTKVHAADRPRVAAALGRCTQPGDRFQVTFRVARPLLGQRHIRASGSLQYHSGRLVFTGANYDITEEKNAASKLAALEARLRLFVENMPGAMAMFDREMRCLVASQGWYLQNQLSSEDASWRCLYDIAPETRLWRDVHQRALAGETVTGDRECLTRADGSTRWLRWQVHPWINYEGEIGGIVIFTEVVDDQVRRENELESATRRAEELASAAQAASAAKTTFLANMSHEIRTPMTAILGYAELLGDEGGIHSPQASAWVRTIHRNGQHLMTIIDDILDLSRIEAGRVRVEKTAVCPLELLREVVDLMQVRAEEKGISLGLRVAGMIPDSIQCDPVRFRQILLNLVGNAVKFTEQGGVAVEASCDKTARMLHVAVIDTGIGMTPAQIERLFDAFSQADETTTRRFGGTGLGLHISQRLAVMLGGVIDVTSHVDEGSCFTLSLPTGALVGVRWTDGKPLALQPPAFVGGSAPTRGAAVNPLSGVRILLVEDGPDNQRLVAHLLGCAGAHVEVAAHGAEALAILLEGGQQGTRLRCPAPVDLIVTDMQMPVMDGYSLARQLRDLGWKAGIIALTAHAMEGESRRCLEAGCDAYAVKPIQRKELIRLCTEYASAGHGTLVSELADDPEMTDLVTEFAAELAARADRLEQLLDSGSVQELVRLAHQLKGAAGGYGFPSITDAAAHVETLALEEGLVAATAAVSRLCSLARAAASGIARGSGHADTAGERVDG